MIDPQEKRKAPQDGPRAQQKQAVSKKREEGIMEGEANTIVRMKAPVERMAEAEPVVKKSIEEMVRQMTLTMDEGLEDYKAEEKKVDSRIAAAEENSRATATAAEAAASVSARAAVAAARAAAEAAATSLF